MARRRLLDSRSAMSGPPAYVPYGGLTTCPSPVNCTGSTLYAFFLKGFTGLAITIGSIITLFVVMQVTGRIRWKDKFATAGPVQSEATA